MKAEKLNIIYVSTIDAKHEDVEFFAWLKYLNDCGLHYDLKNLNVSSPPNIDVLEKIKNEFVYLNIIGVTLIPKLNGVLHILKQNNCFLIAGGGADIVIHSNDILNIFKEIDAVIIGPEIGKVLEQLKGKSFNYVKSVKMQGVAYRKPGNESDIEINESPHLPENLDHLSSIELYKQDCLPAEWYPVIISLGCEYDCQYCGFQLPYLMNFENVKNIRRKKSGIKVVDELEFLYSKGIKKFSFFCHQFFSQQEEHPGDIVSIGEEILKRNLKIEFHFASKPSLILENLQHLDLLREAGLVRIDIGIDSGLERFHKMYKTGSTVEDCIAALKTMHEKNIAFEGFFIFYDPYLTIEEIKENLIFLDKVKGYYSHLSKPFCSYLDSTIFNSTLVLRYGMPIINKLRKDNLLIENPGFTSHPKAIFRDRKVVFFYSIYRAINEMILKKIRHFFYDRELVRMHSFLEDFPIRILEEILVAVNENKYGEIKDYAYDILGFVKNTLEEHIWEIFSNFPGYKSRELEKVFT